MPPEGHNGSSRLRAVAPPVAPGPGAGPEDGPLVERAAAGDAAAFDGLVLRHQDRVYGVCLRLLRDADAARDAAQDAFVKAWRALPRFEGRAQFSTWLYRIATNVCLSALRARKARPEHRAVSLDAAAGESAGGVAEPAAPTPAPGDALDGAEARTAVAGAIASLDEDFRVAVVYRDIEGLSYEQIAEVLQIPVGTVRSRIHRGRDALRKTLEPFMLGRAPTVNSESSEPGTGARPAASEGMRKRT